MMLNLTASTNRIIATVCAMLVGLGLGQTAQAASDTWNQPGGTHEWTDPLNWLSGTQYPDGSGNVASFTNDITSAQSVGITQAVTVGTINIGDSAAALNSFTIGANSAQTINLDNGASASVINSSAAFNVILAKLVATGANKDLNVNVNAPGGILTIGTYDGSVISPMNIDTLRISLGAGANLYLATAGSTFTDPNVFVSGAGSVFVASNEALPTNSIVTLSGGAEFAGARLQDVAEIRGVGSFRAGGVRFVVGSPNANYSSISYGNVTVTNGGRLRPGDISGPGGIGILSMGTTAGPTAPHLEVGGEYYFDIASYTSFDQIDSPRTLTLVNGGDTYLNFLGGFQPTNGAAFNLFIDTSTHGYQDLNGGKVFDNILNTGTGLTNFFYADDGFTATLGGNPFLTALGGPDTEDGSGLGTPFITFTYFIPEPSAVVLLGFAAILLRRRK